MQQTIRHHRAEGADCWDSGAAVLGLITHWGPAWIGAPSLQLPSEQPRAYCPKETAPGACAHGDVVLKRGSVKPNGFQPQLIRQPTDGASGGAATAEPASMLYSAR